MKKIVITLALLIIFLNFCSALSNESLAASDCLNKSLLTISDMKARNISISSVNETYNEAYQTYNGQLALENDKKRTDYTLTFKDCQEIQSTKTVAFSADDELKVFLTNYNSMKVNINLSGMDDIYNEVIKSFREERFNDTLKAINLGYGRMSDIQSSQAAMNLFYSSTSQTLKNFFVKNWMKLLIAFFILGVILLVSNRALTRYFLIRKLAYLQLQRNTINNLIKKLQDDYFRKRKASESEYHTKLDKFESIMRDLERQIPLVREELVKNQKVKLGSKKSKSY